MILYIADRNIRVDNADNQISYNSDYIAEFHFDDEWNGKVKTARFVQNGEYVDIVLVDDRCDIPPLKTGFVRVGVFTDSMTSTYADVYFKTSIKDGSGNPAEPPEDVYAQLTALIESGILRGEDGLTPYVGENNNWWIGDIDTGVLARGTDGYTPVKGVDYFTDAEVKQIQNEVSSGAIGEFKAVVDSETNKYNTNATEKLNAYNTNADSKFTTYNENAEAKFSEYTSNADTKLSEYNQNDSDKTALYNANAESKLGAYDSNAQAKLDLYNQNDSEKTEAYNSNAQTKLTDYNANADNRVAEFNVQTEQIQTDISGLKSDLANKLPKSPADWKQWTAEEQVAARERMGADGVYRHIAYVEITEEGIINIGFDVDINGNPFSLSDIKIYGFIKKMTSNFTLAVALNTKFTTFDGGNNIIKFPASEVSSEIYINKAKYWRAIAFTSQSSDGILGMNTGYSIVSHRGASAVRSNEWEKASSLSICTSNEEGFTVGTIFDIWGR